MQPVHTMQFLVDGSHCRAVHHRAGV
jgi:hypothetical protein